MRRSTNAISLLALALTMSVLVVRAVPIEVQCSDGSTAIWDTQISADGSQTQTQTGPGCQTQTSDDGQQTQSQSQTGSGTQSQTQCSGPDCSPLPPLFTMKPLEWNTMKPLEWNTMRPLEWNTFPPMQMQPWN
ncbi:uncharacterized protein LOC117568458 [Drosophila albomicans]|uniref:Uncharacterized protein LOC117568458 n=1 Tax=Drosophila albomicans TaxID=7291 RepID=A0A6P8X1S5_DROAB|nr:uncharacterized protein LOC117568458 [Drosophila albomicans]